jgi:hypothetical protein
MHESIYFALLCFFALAVFRVGAAKQRQKEPVGDEGSARRVRATPRDRVTGRSS